MIISSSTSGKGMTNMGEKKERKEEEGKDEEALLKMSNRSATIEEAVAKTVPVSKEWHRIDKDLFESRMKAE